jgi:hypothetical protein
LNYQRKRSCRPIESCRNDERGEFQVDSHLVWYENHNDDKHKQQETNPDRIWKASYTAQPAFDLQQAARMIGELSFWVRELLED